MQFCRRNATNYPDESLFQVRFLPLQGRQFEPDLPGSQHQLVLQDQQHRTGYLRTVKLVKDRARNRRSVRQSSRHRGSRSAGIFRAGPVRALLRDEPRRPPLQRGLCRPDSRIFRPNFGANLRPHSHRYFQTFLPIKRLRFR
jgi:hypothetical protein